MIFVLLNEISSAILLFGGMPESLTLLVFGVSLVGATAGLRRFIKRQDEKSNNDSTGITKE